MTDFEMQVMTELSEIKSKATAAEAAATAAAAKSEALETRLFTDFVPTIKTENEQCLNQRIKLETRLTVMEEKHKHDDVKDYIHYATGPFIVAAHAIMRHFGINI